jgi:hypothetical protein
MRLALAALLVVPAWSRLASADSDTGSQPSTRRFSLLSPQEISLRFSYGIGDRESLRFYSLGPRVAYDLLPELIPPIAGNRLRLALELWGAFIHGNGHSRDGEFAFSPLIFDYRYDAGQVLVPFVDGGEGLVLTTLDRVHIGGPFEFSSQAGGGLHLFFTHEDAVTLALRYRHISNAGIKGENSGLNTIFFIVGVSHFDNRP